MNVELCMDEGNGVGGEVELQASVPSPEMFLTVFCRHFKIDEASFERVLVLQGVGALYRPLTRLLLKFRPDLFRIEQEYLSTLRFVRTRREYVSEVGVISDYNEYELPLWRVMLGLRISTRRLTKLRKLLPKQR